MVRIALVVLLFFVGMIPFAREFVVHHPDERHYTDAAIEMLRNRDWLVPHRADGAPRFEKPILTYWVVAGSYAIFGINPLASRLPFLVAGCAVLWLTYQLAWLLYRRREVAELAALILLGHPLLLLGATRSMPDILQCLFILLSAYGFLGLIITEERRLSFYLAAYLGMGLAVATKGLPVLLLVAFAAGFAQSNPWRPVPLRSLVHLPSMVAGSVIGGAWFAAIVLRRLGDGLEFFWVDQVSMRLSPDGGRLATQFLLSLGGFAVTLVPWSVAPLWIWWRDGAAGWSAAGGRTMSLRSFILLWGLVVAVVMSFTIKMSIRYVLLVSPLLAILLADLLVEADSKVVGGWIRWALLSVLAVLAAVTIIGASIAVQVGMNAAEGLVFLLVLVGLGVLAVIGFRGPLLTSTATLGVSVFLFMPLSLLGARHLVLPEQGEQIAANLDKLGWLDGQAIRFIGRPGLASKVRVCSGGQAQLIHVWPGTREAAADHSLAIVEAGEMISVQESKGRVLPVARGFCDVPPYGLLLATLTGRLKAYLDRHKEEHCLVIYHDPAADSSFPARWVEGSFDQPGSGIDVRSQGAEPVAVPAERADLTDDTEPAGQPR